MREIILLASKNLLCIDGGHTTGTAALTPAGNTNPQRHRAAKTPDICFRDPGFTRDILFDPYQGSL